MQVTRASAVLWLVVALSAPAWAAGPIGHITINRNAPVTFSPNVTLNLWATDDAGVTGYFVSANPVPPAPDSPGWVAVGPTATFGANVPFTLSAGTGTNTVYAWYRDAAGNVSLTASDDILLQAAPPAGGPLPAIALQQVASGLALPVTIAHAGDGSGRLFIALQAGKIVIFDGTQILPTPFLELNPPPPNPPKVLCCGEQGLLGLAFHPNYAANGFFYVYYTNPSGENVVARYTVSANPNLADPNSEVILLSVPNPQTNHNGGQLKFGFDGYLYIAKGDGGTGGGPARTLDNLLGKILRIDVDAGLPYGIPPTNPFVGTPGAQPEIWAFGLRNPWRFTFDRLTGDIFIGDVGEGAREEVNLQPAASGGGENYGWSRMEGSLCRTPAPECTNGTLVLPILEYNHDSAGGCSITGGYRYRGSGIPDLYGAYFYGDFCSGRIWGATPDAGGGWTATQMLDTSHNISTFGEDESGELYVAHRATTAGALYRIVRVNVPPTLAFTGEAGYTADGVEPDTGSPSATFTFRVKYTDADGDAPLAGFPRVHILQGATPITGSPFAMSLVSGTPGTGAIYSVSRTLAAGSYTYRFEAVDSQNATATGTPTANQSGPIVSAAACPAQVIVDNLTPGQSSAQVMFTGTWSTSVAPSPFGVNGSLYSNGSGLDTYTWKPPVFSASQACTYQVSVWWTQHANRSTTVPLTVSGHMGGPTTLTVNQRVNGGQWNLHGTYTFPAGAQATVQVTDQNGQANADAVRFVLSTPDSTAPDTTITGGPSGTIATSNATFTWTGSDDTTPTPNLVYAYRLDPLEPAFSAFGPATTKAYTNLANGSYTFSVKARDQAANEDPTPATRAFTVAVLAGGCPAEVIVDNLSSGQSSAQVQFTGTWSLSVAPNPFGVKGSLYSNGSGLDTYTWKPPVFSASQACTYQVFVWWTQHANRSTTVPLTVTGHMGGPTTVTVDQRVNGGQWNLHGIYTFPAGAQATVRVTDQNGQANADAVRFVLVP